MAAVITVSNKLSFAFDPEVLCPLSLFMTLWPTNLLAYMWGDISEHVEFLTSAPWSISNHHRSLPVKVATLILFRSVAQSCPTLGDPMNRSTPGLPVHYQLSEFTQTHIHRVSDAIQPSHPLSSPSPPALNPSQHQSLFQ